MPCGLTAAGLPVGLQIVGPMHADALVLRAARAFESVRPWPLPAAPRGQATGLSTRRAAALAAGVDLLERAEARPMMGAAVDHLRLDDQLAEERREVVEHLGDDRGLALADLEAVRQVGLVALDAELADGGVGAAAAALPGDRPRRCRRRW